MTKEEFLQELARYTKETETQWQVRPNWHSLKKIRCGDGFECPISFVATHKTGVRYMSFEVWVACGKIGLDLDQAALIVNAADGRDNCSQYLRDQLLKATGLT